MAQCAILAHLLGDIVHCEIALMKLDMFQRFSLIEIEPEAHLARSLLVSVDSAH